jgi:glycosyltransferase involved in cell wall biosynthesis
MRSQPTWKNIAVKQVGANKGNAWEQFDLPFYASGRLLFSPANIGPFHYSNQVVTFHDASVFAVPNAYSLGFRLKYWFIFKNLVRKARLIITDSHYSQKELSHYLGVQPDRFVVILLGGDHLNEGPSNNTMLQETGLQKSSYLLTVASQSPHKNFEAVLRAAKAFDKEMVFVAAGGSFKKIFQKTQEFTVPPNVRLLGYIGDQELKALYENALGFIFPSFYEGFGLPVLEAMNCGCPVISSMAASLPEVGGEASLYFDPRNTDSLTISLRRFLSDVNLQNDMRTRGMINAKNFTWEKTARETLSLLHGCL